MVVRSKVSSDPVCISGIPPQRYVNIVTGTESSGVNLSCGFVWNPGRQSRLATRDSIDCHHGQRINFERKIFTRIDSFESQFKPLMMVLFRCSNEIARMKILEWNGCQWRCFSCCFSLRERILEKVESRVEWMWIFFFYIFRRSGCIFFHNSYDIFRTKFVRIYAEWLDLFFYSISSSNREFASFFVHSNFARKYLFEKLLHIHLFLKYVYISRVDFYCKIKDKMDRRKIKGNNFFALDCEQIGISK